MTVQKVINVPPNLASRLSGFSAKAPVQPFDQLLTLANTSTPRPALASGRATDVQRGDTVRNDRRPEATLQRGRREDFARSTQQHVHDFKESADTQDRPSDRSTDRAGTNVSHKKNTEKTDVFGGQATISHNQSDVNKTAEPSNANQSLETQTSDTQQALSQDSLGFIKAQNVQVTTRQTEDDVVAIGSLNEPFNLKTPAAVAGLNTGLQPQVGVVSTTAGGDETTNTAAVGTDQLGSQKAQSGVTQVVHSGGVESSLAGLEAAVATNEQAQGLPEIAHASAKLTGAAVVSQPSQGTQNTTIQNINQENLNAQDQAFGQATADTTQTSDQNSGDTTSRDNQSHNQAESLKAVIKAAAVPANEASASTTQINTSNLTHVTANPAAVSISGPTQQVGIATEASPTAAPLLSEGDTTASNANISRVIRGMHGVINQNGGAVTLRLSPPDMGIVRIEMQIQSGTVAAQLHTEHESARSLLTQQLGQLRHALEAQGLSVDRLNVQTMSQDSATQTADQGTGRSADEGRSRGQYTGQDHDDPDAHHDAEFNGERSDQSVSRFEQELNMVA